MNLEEIRENFKQYGVRAGLHDVARKAAARVVRMRALTCLELTLPSVPAEFLATPAGFDCHFLSDEELARYAKDPVNQMPADWVAQARARGDRCYACVKHGVLASYGWYSRVHGEIDDGLRLAFDARDVYMYKGFTLKSFRGQRLHAIGMAHALRAYVAEGARGIVSWVESNNFASLRSCYRLGYTDIGTIYVVQPRGRMFTFATGQCRARGLSVVSSGTARA